MGDSAAGERRRELGELAREMRGSLGSLRAAAETLEKFPGMDAPRRARLLAAVSEEAQRLSALVERLERAGARQVQTPPLAERTTAADLLAALARAGEDLGLTIASTTDQGLLAAELLLPGGSVVSAMVSFLAALRREMAVTSCRLTLRSAGHHLLLDLAWVPDATELPRLLDWHATALDAGFAEEGPAVPGLRPLVREHDGEAWFNLDREGGGAHVRILLPLAAEPTSVGA